MKNINFFKNAKLKFSNKFKYYEETYISYKKNMTMHCPTHGIFIQQPNVHMRSKFGCLECARDSYKNSLEVFIKQSIIVHGDLYDYTNVKLHNYKTKIEVLCKKHGVFQTTPDRHINSKNGCPVCKLSKGEEWVKKILNKNNIRFEQQKMFNDCKNPITNYKLKFDFYLLDYNILIEFDGIQHFKEQSFFRGFKTLQINDLIKEQYCDLNNIKLIRIDYRFKIIKE